MNRIKCKSKINRVHIFEIYEALIFDQFWVKQPAYLLQNTTSNQLDCTLLVVYKLVFNDN